VPSGNFEILFTDHMIFVFLKPVILPESKGLLEFQTIIDSFQKYNTLK